MNKKLALIFVTLLLLTLLLATMVNAWCPSLIDRKVGSRCPTGLCPDYNGLECGYHCCQGSENCLNPCGCTTSETCPPPPTYYAPKGAITSVTCDTVVGWACDQTNYAIDLQVTLRIDVTDLPPISAGDVHPDASSNCGGNSNHGFTFQVPAEYRTDGSSHTVSVFVRGEGTGEDNTLTTGSRIENCITCSCLETDTTQDIFTYGTATRSCSDGSSVIGYDECTDGVTLVQYSCDLNDQVQADAPVTCIHGCLNGVCNDCTCSETDLGATFAEAGTTSQVCTAGSPPQSSDYCTGSTLTEYYCDANDVIQSVSEICADGCSDGRCFGCTCADPDLGVNEIYEPNAAVRSCDDGSGFTGTDVCSGIDPWILREYYCDAGKNVQSNPITCKFGCFDGACSATLLCACEETDNGAYPEIFGVTTEGCWQNGANQTVQQPDTCSGDGASITEYYCTNNRIAQNIYPCAFGCVSGVCQTCQCTETDFGQDFERQGKTTAECDVGGTPQTNQSIDRCIIDDWTLQEYYCDGYQLASVNYQCYWGCDYATGACRSQSQQLCTCTDSDNGQIYGVYGFTTGECLENGNYVPNSGQDSCSADGWTVTEYYCDASLKSQSVSNACYYGCENGACRASPACSCLDSDSGLAYDIYGFVTEDCPVNSQIEQNQGFDECTDEWNLVEYYCDANQRLQSIGHSCYYGCDATRGKCKSSLECTCDDSDNGQDSFTFGTATQQCAEGGNINTQTRNDTCSPDGWYVVEAFCDGTAINSIYLECYYGCLDGICRSDQYCICDDTDGGQTSAEFGTVTQQCWVGQNIITDTQTDACTSDGWAVKEYYCGGQDVYSTNLNCYYGCEFGVCNDEMPCTCTDSDGGQDSTVEGTTTRTCRVGRNLEIDNRTDTCSADGWSVEEYYCDANNLIKSAPHTCNYACANGACNTDLACTCSETDGGQVWSLYGIATKECQEGGATTTTNLNDTCLDLWTVQEYYCSNDDILSATNPCFYGCEAGQCRSEVACYCTDTDTGQDFDILGTATRQCYVNGVIETSSTGTDYCSADGSSVTEYYCNGELVSSITQSCTYGCENGACRGEPVCTCTDSDNGQVYNRLGTAVQQCRTGNVYERIEQTDTCVQFDWSVQEFYCTGGLIGSVVEPCQYGCLDGICRSAAVCTCDDSDNGQAYELFGVTTTECMEAGSPQITEYLDNCFNDWSLEEYYCIGNSAISTVQSCVYGCDSGACRVDAVCSCLDSDGGQIFSTPGSTREDCEVGGTTQTATSSDACLNQWDVEEYYCDGDRINTVTQSCLNGCSAGACRPEPVCSCSDSDGGLVTDLYGTATRNCFVGGTTETTESADVCITDQNILESFCSGDSLEIVPIQCLYGCENGQCRAQPLCVCMDTDGGQEFGVYGLTTQQCMVGGLNITTDRVNDVCTPDGMILNEYYCAGTDIMVVSEPCLYGCEYGTCRLTPTCTCVDSDGGLVFDQEGTINQHCISGTLTINTSARDICIGANSLEEYYCDGVDIASQTQLCPYGCQNNVCRPPTICSCSDTDTGQDYFTWGQATQLCITGESSSNKLVRDECLTDQLLQEAYCIGDDILNESMSCANGCENGACRTTPRCADSDGGRDYFHKGVTSKGASASTDSCADCEGDPANPTICHSVQEYYCGADSIQNEVYICPDEHFCIEGACVEQCIPEGETCGGIIEGGCCYGFKCQKTSTAPGATGTCVEFSQLCSDTDGGLNYVNRGTVTIETYLAGRRSTESFRDTCIECTGGAQCWSVKEWYCDGNLKNNESFSCRYGCESGACSCAPEQVKETCSADSNIYWLDQCTSGDVECCGQNSCVDPITRRCYQTDLYVSVDGLGTTYDFDTIAHCTASGVWEDCDSSELTCNDVGDCAGLITGCPNNNCWIPTGEDFVGEAVVAGSDQCCGDDIDEVYSGGTDGTYACCDGKDTDDADLSGPECVLKGVCTDRTSIAEVCGDLIDNDCDGIVDEDPCQCVDTDGGIDEFTPGQLSGGNNLCPQGLCIDECNADAVQEWYCEAGGARTQLINCPNGCSDGACGAESCDQLSCQDYCDGDTLYHTGECVVENFRARCVYDSYDCQYGCSSGECIDADHSQTRCEQAGFNWISEGPFCCGDDTNEWSKTPWGEDVVGCCPQQTNCLIDQEGSTDFNNQPEKWFDSPPARNGPRCVDTGQYILDHLCADGEWTSRTSYVATQLLDKASASSPEDYTVLCGPYKDVLNYYDYILPSGDNAQIYMTDNGCRQNSHLFGCLNNFCVLTNTEGTIVAFGSAMNPGMSLDDIYTFLDDSESCGRNADGQFHDCGFLFLGSKLWYNHLYGLFIYGEQDNQDIQLNAINFPIRFESLVQQPFDNVMISHPNPDSALLALTQAIPDYSSMYLSRVYSRSVLGRSQEVYYSPINFSNIMIINYDDFETNVCWDVNSLLWGSCKVGENRSYYVSATSEQGAYNPLFNYWGDLTAELRINP